MISTVTSALSVLLLALIKKGTLIELIFYD
jgi:hypothetical protein